MTEQNFVFSVDDLHTFNIRTKNAVNEVLISVSPTLRTQLVWFAVVSVRCDNGSSVLIGEWDGYICSL